MWQQLKNRAQRLWVRFLYLYRADVIDEKVARLELLYEQLAAVPNEDPELREQLEIVRRDLDELKEMLTTGQKLRPLVPKVRRLRILLSQDLYLTIAIPVGLGLSTYFLIEAIPQLWVAIHWLVQHLISDAKGQVSSGPIGALSLKDSTQIGILSVVSVAFFCALGMLAFSGKTDTRKIAADMIKTILGFYVGRLA